MGGGMLGRLPGEILELLVLHCASSFNALIQTCRLLRGVGRDPSTRARVLLCEYNISLPASNGQLPPARSPFVVGPNAERWNCVVQDSRFSVEVGERALQLHLVDPQGMEVLAEYAVAQGCLPIIERMLPIPFGVSLINTPAHALELLRCSLIQSSLMNEAALVRYLVKVVHSFYQEQPRQCIEPDSNSSDAIGEGSMERALSTALILAAKHNNLDALLELLGRPEPPISFQRQRRCHGACLGRAHW
ncbi:hypothetical protein DFJ73DRAFT_864888 [Zopfochytrium polystomum]|nr:hypothetical protein DFJ73DRAFT_864888 [Zopfochytrium polystomum]